MAARLRLAMVILGALPAASASFAQSGPAWHWENVPPLRKRIRDIWRAGDRVIAVGEQGAVVRSTDGGATWNVIPTGSETDLERIHRVGPNDVYALGRDGGTVSNDDGRHFAPLALGLPREITTFFAPAPGDVRVALCHAQVRDRPTVSPPIVGVIARSTDHGRTFVSEKGSWGDCWVAIADLGDAGLFAAGVGGAIARHGGAAGWIIENDGAIHDGKFEARLTALARDEKGPFAVAKYDRAIRLGLHRMFTVVLRRELHDGRARWVRVAERDQPKALPLAPEPAPLERAPGEETHQFIASWARAPGDLVGVGDAFGRSLDGGLTWSLQPTIGTILGIARGGSHASVVGLYGLILRTDDGGKSWRSRKHDWAPYPFAPSFAWGRSAEDFFIGTSMDGRRLLRTHDGGGLWEPVGLPEGSRVIRRMLALPGDELYAVGWGGLGPRPEGFIFHRPAGAGAFDAPYSFGMPWVNGWSFGGSDVWASGADDVWACDSGGNLHHTRDRGKTWTVLSASAGQLLAVAGASADEVYAVGDGGVIVRVRGGGATLETRPSPVRGRLLGVWAGGGAVYVVSQEGDVLRSGDHGDTFVRVLNAGAPLTAISGEGREDVWIAGERGIILHHY